jgi:hypothetical protein
MRPPFSEDRLKLLPNGDVRFALEKPWTDGTTHIDHTPLEFMAKLAALVTKPGKNNLIYRGVFAPNHRPAPSSSPSAAGARPNNITTM